MAKISRIGYGQVEPNHLSAQRTGQIYAQLPANAEIEVLENGQFVKYDYANKEVNFSGAGQWMMVFNEVKLYDDRWRESYKDFALEAKNFTKGSEIIHNGLGNFRGQMTPRVFKINIGDIYTTNCLEEQGARGKVTEMDEYEAGNILKINDEGFLSKNGTSEMEFEVAKVYTMPDGQAAVKVMRIK